MIAKQVWLENITAFLKQIASAEFQEKGWVRNEIHDYCTFVETILGLFSDSNFEEFIDERARGFGLSDEQIKQLDKVRCALNHYVEEHSVYEYPEVIVNDPEWHKIRKMAKDALTSLGIVSYLDPSKSIFRNALLYRTDDIRDKKTQERVWIRERRPNSNPFRELLDKFFTGARAKEVIDSYKDFEITEEQQALLRRLHDILLLYREKHKHEEDLQEILDDPEWQKIQALAGEIVKAFDFKR